MKSRCVLKRRSSHHQLEAASRRCRYCDPPNPHRWRSADTRRISRGLSALCEAAQEVAHGIAQVGQSFTVRYDSCTSATTGGIWTATDLSGGTVSVQMPGPTYWLSSNTGTTLSFTGDLWNTTTANTGMGGIQECAREEPRAEKIIQVHEYIKSFQRAKKLFKEWLSEEEYKVYKRYGRIVIQSKVHIRREYHILAHSPVELTEVYESGEFSHSLCIHDDERQLPKLDRLLSKILLLKSDEQQYERTGNRRSMRAFVPMERRRVPIPLLHAPTSVA